MNLTRRSLAALGLALALLVGGAGARAADTTAEAFVRQLGDDIVAVLSDQSLDKAGKLEELKGLLDGATDLDLVAKLVMGPTWRQASADQQEAYTQAFRQLVMRTMADQLGTYNGEIFTVVGSEQVNERDSVVRTQIERPSGQPSINVEWRVRDAEGKRLVIDIVAEGVSLIVTQRQEVASIVNQRGIDGLIDAINERVRSNEPIDSTKPLEG